MSKDDKQEYKTVSVGQNVIMKDPRSQGVVVAKRYLRPDDMVCVRTEDGKYHIRVLNEIVGFGFTPHIEKLVRFQTSSRKHKFDWPSHIHAISIKYK